MKKRKAFFNYILMLFVLLFGLLIVWFIVGLPFGFNANKVEIAEEVDIKEGFGSLYEYSNESISMQTEEGDILSYSMDENTKYYYGRLDSLESQSK